VPLFEAGRAQAKRAEGDALLQRRRSELENVKGQIDLEVRSSLLDVQAASQQLEAAQTTVTLANQELEQARDRFAAGVASNIEVTQAQETVAAASESYLAALYAHNLAKASLARAAGIAETAVIQYLGGMQ
jgi:outer membrane protein TolC